MEKIETVGDLISALQRFAADAPVHIKDADTDWLLKITEMREVRGHVVVGGDYMDYEREDSL